MTTSEVAELLGITDARVRQLIASGDLPAEKFGWGVWLVKRQDAEAYREIRPKRGRPPKSNEQ